MTPMPSRPNSPGTSSKVSMRDISHPISPEDWAHLQKQADLRAAQGIVRLNEAAKHAPPSLLPSRLRKLRKQKVAARARAATRSIPTPSKMR